VAKVDWRLKLDFLLGGMGTMGDDVLQLLQMLREDTKTIRGELQKIDIKIDVIEHRPAEAGLAIGFIEQAKRYLATSRALLDSIAGLSR
jgi:hypothetical protein